MVTDAFFPMFDNLDTAVTEKTGQIKELTKRVSALEEENFGLHDAIRTQAKDFEGLLQAMKC